MRHKSYVMAALAMALAVGACTESTSDLDEDMLVALAEQAAGNADDDVQAMRAPGIPGLGFPRMLAGLDETPDCPQTAGVYMCTFEGRLGLSMALEVTFMDVAGGVQIDGYDEEATASINVVSSTTGDFTGMRGSRSIDRVRDMTVSGLEGEESTRVWNGTSEGTSSHTFANGDFAGVPLVRSSSSTIADVTIPHPKDDDSWPLSGTITSELIVEGGDRAGEYLSTVTFDGTQFASVVINGEEMSVDLTNRKGFRGRHGRK
ncbi:MAG: hypothetical protein ACI9OJ_004161 [Myxococcota bacterium]|jgi:hypothetical protein